AARKTARRLPSCCAHGLRKRNSTDERACELLTDRALGGRRWGAAGGCHRVGGRRAIARAAMRGVQPTGAGLPPPAPVIALPSAPGSSGCGDRSRRTRGLPPDGRSPGPDLPSPAPEKECSPTYCVLPGAKASGVAREGENPCEREPKVALIRPDRRGRSTRL